MGVEAIADQPAPYDFGVSSRLSREAVVGLKRIHATAADELEVLLSRSFGEDIRVSNVHVTQVRYEQFVAAAPLGSYHFLMGSESLGGQFQAAFDPDSTAKMLALVFGSESVTNNRELSLVDARVLDSRVGLFVEALNRSFAPYFQLGLASLRSMINPKQVKIIDDNETVVQAELHFAVGVSKTEFCLRICYPQDDVTPVLVALSDVERASATEALHRSTPIQQSLMRVKLPVSVQLPTWVMNAESVESLAVGDVVRNGIPTTTPPRLCIADKPLLDVNTFAIGQRIAAEVLHIHHTGTPNHAH